MYLLYYFPKLNSLRDLNFNSGRATSSELESITKQKRMGGHLLFEKPLLSWLMLVIRFPQLGIVFFVSFIDIAEPGKGNSMNAYTGCHVAICRSPLATYYFLPRGTYDFPSDTVLVPPQVKMFPGEESIDVEQHNEITLNCSATGVPQPLITWTFNVSDFTHLPIPLPSTGFKSSPNVCSQYYNRKLCIMYM